MATEQEVAAHLTGYPRVLTWNDFRPVPHSPRPPFKAQTVTQFNSSFGGMRLVNGVFRFTTVRVTVQLLRGVNQSWVDSSWLNDPGVSQSDKDSLLLHEQGHFDIIGAIARDLCRGLLDLQLDESMAMLLIPSGRANTAANRQAAANEYFRRETRRLNDEAAALRTRLENRFVAGQEIEGQYERETNHGLVTAEQRIWNDIFFLARERDCALPLALVMHNK